MTEIDAVRSATDIVALIAESIDLAKSGQDYHARCPFHEEKTPSFTISHDKQFYHCFGCGAHGDAFDWLMEYSRLPFRQALDELAGRAGIAIGENLPGERVERKNKKLHKEIEAAMHHELTVLNLCVGERVAVRQIPADTIHRYPHIVVPDDNPLEREVKAARRVAKAIYARYGVRA